MHLLHVLAKAVPMPQGGSHTEDRGARPSERPEHNVVGKTAAITAYCMRRMRYA